MSLIHITWVLTDRIFCLYKKQFRSKEELVGRHILVHADGELVSNMVHADEDLVKKDHPYAAEPLDNKK